MAFRSSICLAIIVALIQFCHADEKKQESSALPVEHRSGGDFGPSLSGPGRYPPPPPPGYGGPGRPPRPGPPPPPPPPGGPSGPADPWPLNRPDMPSIKAINVQCEKSHMRVYVEFDRPFYGMIFSKGHYSDPNCVHMEPGTGSLQTQFDIYLNSCGMTASGNQYGAGPSPAGSFVENTIIVQYDPLVQEVWDQARRLRCTWYDYYEKAVTFRPFNVDMLDAVTANFLGDNLQCWMQIQVGKGPWASEVSGIVKIGQTMTMVLAIKDDENKFDMLVRNCVAHDGRRAPIQLVDQYGCVTRPKIMSRFQKIKNFGPSASVVSYAYFQAFKFPDSMNVHFQCVIQVCRHQCPEPRCGPGGPPGLPGPSGPPSGPASGPPLPGPGLPPPPPGYLDPRIPLGGPTALPPYDEYLSREDDDEGAQFEDEIVNGAHPVAKKQKASLNNASPSPSPAPAFNPAQNKPQQAPQNNNNKVPVVPGGHARPSPNHPQQNPNANKVQQQQQQVPNLRPKPANLLHQQQPSSIPLRVPPPPQRATKREGLAPAGFDMGPDVSLIGGRPRSMKDEPLATAPKDGGASRKKREVVHAHVYKREAIEMTDISTQRVIQVVAPGDVAFNLNAANSGESAEEAERREESGDVVSAGLDLESGKSICMSLPGFAAGLVMLLLVLVVAALVAAFMFLRIRSYSRKSAHTYIHPPVRPGSCSSMSGYDNPEFVKVNPATSN